MRDAGDAGGDDHGSCCASKQTKSEHDLAVLFAKAKHHECKYKSYASRDQDILEAMGIEYRA